LRAREKRENRWEEKKNENETRAKHIQYVLFIKFLSAKARASSLAKTAGERWTI
jgi:hypothetical protein